MSQATIGQSVDQWVSEACARRLPAEMHFTDADGMIITARVRFLDQTADEILTDRPQYLDDEAVIPPGCGVTVHMVWGGARLQFDSVVVDEDRVVRVNAHQTLPGIALRKPLLVTASQRRTHLRVSVVGYEPISVEMAAPHREFPDACDIDVQRISGWLLDLSVGGLSVVLDHRVLRGTRRGERFFVTFGLPGMKGDFNMLGSVRHCRSIRNGESLRVATCFCPWNGKHFARDQHRLSRFIAEHERRMLRRRR